MGAQPCQELSPEGSCAQDEGAGKKGSQDTIPLQRYVEEDTPRKESSSDMLIRSYFHLRHYSSHHHPSTTPLTLIKVP
jgi:hypothetical protein